MNRSHWVVGLSLGAAVAGCVSVRIRETPIAAGTVESETVIGAVVANDWCYGRRWIGVLPKSPTPAECPKPKNGYDPTRNDNGWSVEPLFKLDPPSRDGGERPRGHHHSKRSRPSPSELSEWAREEGLDRYCLYTRKRATDTAKPELEFPLEELTPDFCGLVPTAGAVATAPSLVDHTGPVLHQLTLDSVAPPPAGPVVAQVRLAILDTLPSDKTSLPAADLKALCSRHGDSLFRLAEELACRRQPCKVDVTAQLALATTPIDDPAASKCTIGGTVGWVSDTAVAVVKELLQWTRTANEERLVLNLSLGWNDKLFAPYQGADGFSTAERAVYDSLLLARRAGALTFAAAGNATPGPHAGQGPLMPAGWETREPRPVVYAVSGLSLEGKLLANTRPLANARRAAFGGPMSVPYGGAEGYSPPLVGSSVGTAVASSAAAAHWSRHPGDSVAQVVRAIETGGGQWKADRSFDLDEGPGHPIGPAKACRPTLSPWGVAVVPLVAQKVQTPEPPVDSIANRPFSHPQPGSDPCPPCAVDPPKASGTNLQLWIELNSGWDWEKLCVRLEAVEVLSSTDGTSMLKIDNQPCWIPPSTTAKQCSPPSTQPVTATAPSAIDLPYSSPLAPGDSVKLHWLVVDRCSGNVEGSALSTPFVGK